MIDIGENDIDELEAEHSALIDDPHKQWRFDDRRRHVIKTSDDVQACPGSGKTTLVAAKLLILAKKWKEPYKGICVLTHTNVARDEIISMLHNHPAGFRLTSYPHFIGTIQEFVNRFLGLPYLRSSSAAITKIDDDACCQVIDRNLAFKTKKFFENRYDSPHDLKLFFLDEDISLNIPGFPKESPSASYKNLCNIKGILLDRGLYFFSEMYTFGKALVFEHPEIISALQKRFPIVIIDEMQDTQKFQDTLINQIFDHENVLLQRLGDPDQAIFDGIGGDEPNNSYNGKENLYSIKTSHRFGLDICSKIIGLSYNKLDQLSSDRDPSHGNCSHTIFLYGDTSCELVLDAFGDLVAREDLDNKWGTVKAVGGVEGSGEVGHISKYWSKYDRSKSASSPKPKKLIHIAYLCQEQSKGHLSSNFDLLVQGIVDLLRKADIKTRNKDGNEVYFSRRSLMWWLKEKEKYHEFRKILASIMLDADLSVARWAAYIEKLKAIHELNALTTEANEFLEHDATLEAVDEDIVTTTNMYLCESGREIEVGTIHSVKGETHDATLILETKYYQDDVNQMLPYIIDATKGQPTTDRKKSFMRKLYVAGSRPRHLLCMAMHKDNISDGQIADLIALEWSVLSVLGAQENDG